MAKRKTNKRNKSNISKGEQAVKKVLDQMGLNYIYDKTYPGLVNKQGNKMRFDFLIVYKDKHYVIEYDGEQHFQPISYDGNLIAAKKRLIKTKENDRLKDEFCKIHNIPILRIPYYQLPEIREVISEFLYNNDVNTYTNDKEKNRILNLFFKKIA